MAKPFEVAVIGAGMSGLFLGYHLKKAGIDFTLYEASDDVGGTWRQNTYPGLHVDVVTRRYEFPFARNYSWSKRYAPGPEIQRYLRDFAGKQGLTAHTRLRSEVTEAQYTDGRWTIRLRDGSAHAGDAVVSATGFLRVPRVPKLPGAESFAGTSFHSSRWDHSIDLTGKRIGVIGTGSSGIQIVSELGKHGYQVTHFIRTPQWILIKQNPAMSPLERLLLRLPGYARRWDAQLAAIRVQTEGPETWRLKPGPDRDDMGRRYLESLEREIADPELRRRLTPDEPLGCKRIPRSPDYYQVVQRPNVQCAFGPVSSVEPRGIVDSEGVLHELDVLVYATGFDTHAYMRPMTVTGLDGVTIDDLWREGVYSYRGVAVPSMPNFFLLTGPFAPVNSLAIPTCLDHEVGFLMRLLAVSRERGVALAPTAGSVRSFRDEIIKALPRTTYSLCDNWFTDQSGAPIVWPFTAAQHEAQFQSLELADFDTFAVGPTQDSPELTPVTDTTKN